MNNASNPEPNRPQPGKNRVVGPLLAFGILIMGFSIIQPFQMTGQASGGAEGSGCGGEVVGDLEEAKSPDHPEPIPPPQPDLRLTPKVLQTKLKKNKKNQKISKKKQKKTKK